MAIEFEPDFRWEINTQTMTFYARQEIRRIRCAVSRPALEDRFRAHGGRSCRSSSVAKIRLLTRAARNGYSRVRSVVRCGRRRFASLPMQSTDNIRKKAAKKTRRTHALRSRHRRPAVGPLRGERGDQNGAHDFLPGNSLMPQPLGTIAWTLA